MKYFYLLFYHYEILFLIVLLLFHVFPISHFHYSFIYFLSLFSVSLLFCVLIDYFIDKIISQVSRVYVGSFHDKPIAREEHSVLFAKDREVLLGRLRDLPKVRNTDYSIEFHNIKQLPYLPNIDSIITLVKQDLQYLSDSLKEDGIVRKLEYAALPKIKKITITN